MKNTITVLDQNTIDKIAAGEVVERPASVVKELVENAIDAGASAITAEIRGGGISLIRITDNGSGIPGEQVSLAFLRHATSKIRQVEDLQSLSSLGFRGEALSSIAAVSQVELITKTRDSLLGVRYLIEGGKEVSLEDVGAPDGTTFLVRNLFYNTPARAKFLKTPATESGYISSFMEQLAMSHPSVSFKYIQDGKTRLHTSGNNNLKEVIYQIYGRDITGELLDISWESPDKELKICGYLGKPTVSRGNRNFENYYVNGRYVKSRLITRAIEDAYHTFMMQHKYPFTAFCLDIDGDQVDINVHPTKMEVRFSRQEFVYQQVYQAIRETLKSRELIPQISLEKKTQEKAKPEVSAAAPEPFETRRRQLEPPVVRESGAYLVPESPSLSGANRSFPEKSRETSPVISGTARPAESIPVQKELIQGRQMDLFDGKLLSPESRKRHRILGQIFDTYWLVQMDDQLYIIDQHAAHERVLYERIIAQIRKQKVTSQILCPPLVITLNMKEQETLKRNLSVFASLGFEMEPFGGKEYSIRAVPQNLYGLTSKEMFTEILDHLDENSAETSPERISDRLATMACKAAVKGNSALSAAEARALIDELLELENPYHCPHGRPTIIAMSRQELEKKFKRIV